MTNIFLIGPMGSGKSTIAKHISKQSSLVFYDSDAEIIKQRHSDINEIFQQEGEQSFRRYEQQVIEKLVKKAGIVLATGGGCVITPINRKNLTQKGIVIYLRVSPQAQLHRLASSEERPLFSAKEPKKLFELTKLRTPLYESIANFSYDTDNTSPEKLAEKILTDCSQ